jgi:hypothetical protein
MMAFMEKSSNLVWKDRKIVFSAKKTAKIGNMSKMYNMQNMPITTDMENMTNMSNIDHFTIEPSILQ